MRVVRFQPGGLVGEQRIGGGVAFVETVAGELVDQIEQLTSLLRLDPREFLTPGNEAGALRVHFLLVLLAHGAAQQIGITQRIAGQHLRGLHDLFLIDEYAVCFGENSLQLGMRIFNRFGPVLAAAKQRDVIHRPRPVERDERDDVAKSGWLHRRQRAAHPFGFELEDADRVARLKQTVNPLVIPGQCRQIDLDVAAGHQLGRLLEH